MKVVGLQIGKIRTLHFKDQEMESAIFKSGSLDEIKIQREIVNGDEQADRKHHGGKDKAVYALSTEIYKEWPFFHDLAPQKFGAFGENLTIDSFREEEIGMGDLFHFQNCVLQATFPRIPCRTLNFQFQNMAAIKKFTEISKSGIYFRVLSEGAIKIEEIARIEKKETARVSIQEVFSVIMGKPVDTDFPKRLELLRDTDDETKTFIREKFEKKRPKN